MDTPEEEINACIVLETGGNEHGAKKSKAARGSFYRVLRDGMRRREVRMRLNRLLRQGSAGEDVLTLKQRLLELGCYAPHIAKVETNAFGADTKNAVRAFQAKAGLVADGM